MISHLRMKMRRLPDFITLMIGMEKPYREKNLQTIVIVRFVLGDHKMSAGIEKTLVETPNFTNPAILLHPNIPKPMHGVNPRTIMGQEWWDEQRQRAYEENNFCCWACGVHKSQAAYHKWLEAHECYEIDYIAGRMYMRIIVALCHS